MKTKVIKVLLVSLFIISSNIAFAQDADMKAENSDNATIEIPPTNEKKQAIRVVIGYASGEMTYRDDTVLSGCCDHTLSGAALGVSYIKTLPNNMILGGGYEVTYSSGYSGMSEDKYVVNRSGTDYYFMVSSETLSFTTDYIYGFVGYNFEIVTGRLSFRPNIRIGLKMAEVEVASSVHYYYPYIETSTNIDTTSASEMAYMIDLPITFRTSATGNFRLGGNLLIGSGTDLVLEDGNAKYTFTTANVLNFHMDFLF